MKLSAPPPPPPPPPEQPAPEEQPSAKNPETGVTAPEPPPPEVPATPPAPKLLQWPAWYSGMDAVLVALMLVLAFAVASFVARNSDLWLHLAAGQRLLTGQYTPGSDPFSYSAADRPWVNHSWLTDAVGYLLYGGQGKLLVIVKALLVTLTFGLLIAIRRPKFSLWPWAATACVAILATAPYLNLRPQIVSMLFLAVTLYLLFGLPHRANSWRFPIAIGITFWLWANADPWFFIGPLALVLVLIGELIQTMVLKVPEGGTQEPTGNTEGVVSPSAPEEEPLGRLPDTLTLAKALVVGVLVCMLNPHHVRVWELPIELIHPAGGEADPRVRFLFYTPLDRDYYTTAGLGYNINGLSYAVLFVAGAAVLGFGYGRVRVSHVALWLGFAALTLRSIYTIPFFAIVAVPLVAAQLNALSLVAELRTWGDPRSRFLLIGSSLGRILCLLGLIVLCVLAYPGWVHPESSNPAYARRVGWGVEVEPSLQQAAEQFQRWRESGQLPADEHGLITNPDLANYVAWFAPQEKVFINTRYHHHSRELTDYVAVRKGLGLIGTKDDRPNPREVTEVLKKINAEYVAIHAGPSDPLFLRGRALSTALAMYRDWDTWSPWYVDGRTLVCGWHAPGATARPTFAALRVDPVVLAFGPNVAFVPAPDVHPPPAPLGWEEAFVRPQKPTPLGGSEANGWLLFKQGPAIRQDRRQKIRDGIVRPLFAAVPSLTATSMHQAALFYAQAHGVLQFAPNENTSPEAAQDAAAVQAIPILAMRAARRAIAENPDHPEPYFALASVLQDPDLPLTEGERTLGIVSAYRQCLERMPKPERYRRGQFLLADPVEVALGLARVYLGQPIGRIDPKTRKQTILGFVGMPLNVSPFHDALGMGQVVYVTPRGELERVPYAAVRTGRFRIPRGSEVLTGNTPCLLSLDGARAALKKALEFAAVDVISDPELAKQRVEEIEQLLKAVESEMVRANERYTQVKNRGGKLADLIEVSLNTGLPEETLKLLTESDLAKEFGNREAGAVLLRIALSLSLGHLEEADILLAPLATPEQAAVFDRMGLTPTVLRLRYLKCLHAGEYKAAGEVWENLVGVSVGVFSKLPPVGPTVPRGLILGAVSELHGLPPEDAAKRLVGLLAPPTVPMGTVVPSLFWVSEWDDVKERIRRQIDIQLRTEANYFSQRGVLALLEGDIPTAKQWFMQSTRKPPPGWNLSDIGHIDAQRYLFLIKMAENKKPAP